MSEKYSGIVMDHPLIKDLVTSLKANQRPVFMRLIGIYLRDNWRGIVGRVARDKRGGQYIAVKNCPESVLTKAFTHAKDRLKAASGDQTTTPAAPPEPKPAAPDVEDLLIEVRHVVNTLNALCDEVERLRGQEAAFRHEIARLTAASRRAMAVYGD